MQKKEALLSIKGLCISFTGQKVLNDFTLDVRRHEKLVLKGKSGIGKSSLVKALLGFTGKIEGEIIYEGKKIDEHNINDLRAAVAWMPQGLDLSDEPVIDFLKMPFSFRQNAEHKFDEVHLRELMHQFELEDKLLKKKLNQLSGGERQRFILILCLMMKRPLMLLDEPTASLDSDIRDKVVQHLFELRDTGILFITHDPVITKRADRVVKI
ncbi:MAG: ATP-binding cassette domain-containing protein [Bacteroidota bacterium]|nr:ATP-binding cassette domain-containing protein [Bacteroidota bacterium]